MLGNMPTSPFAEEAEEMRRLDALESKLTSLAGMPRKSPPGSSALSSASQLSPAPMPATVDFEDEIEDEDLAYEDDSAGALSSSHSSGASPMGALPPFGAKGRRLSPLDASMHSLDESLSPSTLADLRGFDHTEPVELPKKRL